MVVFEDYLGREYQLRFLTICKRNLLWLPSAKPPGRGGRAESSLRNDRNQAPLGITPVISPLASLPLRAEFLWESLIGLKLQHPYPWASWEGAAVVPGWMAGPNEITGKGGEGVIQR